MLNEKQMTRIFSVIPKLRSAAPELVRQFREIAFHAPIPAGHEVFAFGDDVNAIALLISGTVRVYKVSDTGREITLYRFSAGESCILTANAILNNETFSAIAVVEQDAEAILIPAEDFRAWVNEHPLWREFVFELMSQRLSNVIEIVDEVAFGRLDVRVATFLLERSASQHPIRITHQTIADELGSSREVISRVLGSFASENLIHLGRGIIEILNQDALKAYAIR